MALFVRQDENRSELQQRLATELQDRARKKAKEAELPDGVNDSQFIKGTKQSTNDVGVWIIVGIIVLVAIAVTVLKIIT